MLDSDSGRTKQIDPVEQGAWLYNAAEKVIRESADGIPGVAVAGVVYYREHPEGPVILPA
jgi:hypothetical protein